MLEAKFYETYYFCNVIRNVLFNQFDFIRNLHEFYGDEQIFNLIEPFEKYSTFHYFIEFIVEDVYYEEVTDLDLEKRKRLIEQYKDLPPALQDLKLTKLPIESAFEFHSIEHTTFNEFLSDRSKDFTSCDDDDLYDYMTDLRDSGEYYKLIQQTVKEVFHVLFQNRSLMLRFNDMMASILKLEKDSEPPEEALHFFKRPGILNRKSIPKWVQRAVFFRDRGRCVLCDKDLSGMINLDNTENYDHIVPLARHGLNDVSNIQLLCKECNQNEKKAGEAVTSNNYQSWYVYDEI